MPPGRNRQIERILIGSKGDFLGLSVDGQLRPLALSGRPIEHQRASRRRRRTAHRKHSDGDCRHEHGRGRNAVAEFPIGRLSPGGCRCCRIATAPCCTGPSKRRLANDGRAARRQCPRAGGRCSARRSRAAGADHDARGCSWHRGSQLSSKLAVVVFALLGIEQTNSGRRKFVQQTLALLGMFADLERSQMSHLTVSGMIDHIGVGLEKPDAEQPIMIGRLFFRRNAEPDMVGIERFRQRHSPGPWGSSTRDRSVHASLRIIPIIMQLSPHHKFKRCARIA